VAPVSAGELVIAGVALIAGLLLAAWFLGASAAGDDADLDLFK
jgi:hypothetical protein